MKNSQNQVAYSRARNVIKRRHRHRLSLRLPQQLFGGKQTYLILGLEDNPVNRKIAEARARRIEDGILLGQFDPSLESYKSKKRVVNDIKSISIYAPWLKYIAYQQPGSSPTYDDWSLWANNKIIEGCTTGA